MHKYFDLSVNPSWACEFAVYIFVGGIFAFSKGHWTFETAPLHAWLGQFIYAYFLDDENLTSPKLSLKTYCWG